MIEDCTQRAAGSVRQHRLECLLFVLGCLAAAAAGVLYLSVTRLLPPGGDDCVNNPRNFYEITHQPLLETLSRELDKYIEAFTLQAGRFFPCYLPSVLPLHLACATVDSYRLYIIVYSLVLAAVMGAVTVQLTGSRWIGLACFALMPLMFCLWSQYATNGMYCYSALPQAALLAAALSALCMVAWSRTRHLRWAVLSALFMLISCATYEIGYTFLVPIGLLALMLHDRFPEAVKTGLPALSGECTALVFYVGNSLNGGAVGGGYDGVSPSLEPAKVLHTWVCQMSAGFPLNALWLGGAEKGTQTVGDILWPLVLGIVAAGASILALPALLIALSEKYQAETWVNWESGYIPAVAESFGVGLMLLAVLLAVFQALRRYRRPVRAGTAVLLAVLLTVCGMYQRSATRTRYAGLRDPYDLMTESLQAGLLDQVPDNAVLLSGMNVWGGNHRAEEIVVLLNTGRNLDTYFKANWTPDLTGSDRPVYLYEICCDYGGYDLIWSGRAQDTTLQRLDSLKVYVDGNAVPDGAVLRYRTMDDAGSVTECADRLQDLPQSGRTDDNGYFVCVEDEDIVAGKITIWQG